MQIAFQTNSLDFFKYSDSIDKLLAGLNKAKLNWIAAVLEQHQY